MKTSKSTQRYSRQIQLKGFGQPAQDKLQHAAILVIGAGGLGCPALQYLAACGVGTIGIIDFDTIDLSNLHRQILFDGNDIGKSKAIIAAQKLRDRNPGIKIEPYNFSINNKNALDLISKYDLVIDGSDNYSTRYLVNDACVLLNKPLIYGAVLRFEGQIGVFNLEDNETGSKTNYRDLFPSPPASESSFSCEEVGVLGVVPGIIGTMQATEAIKIITGIGSPLCNKILTYNALDNSFYEIKVSVNEKTNLSIPNDGTSFQSFNYDWFCGIPDVANEISPKEFDELRTKEKLTIIDVREEAELPLITEFTCLNIPLSIFEASLADLFKDQKIIILCNTGKRSSIAVIQLKEKSPESIVLNLSGGILAWNEFHENINR